jgi:hypothetical protein
MKCQVHKTPTLSHDWVFSHLTPFFSGKEQKEMSSQRDWEYYSAHVPVERQIPETLFKQLPPGPSTASRLDRVVDDGNQHEVFNVYNFPTPFVSTNTRLSYASKVYDYPRK